MRAGETKGRSGRWRRGETDLKADKHRQRDEMKPRSSTPAYGFAPRINKVDTRRSMAAWPRRLGEGRARRNQCSGKQIVTGVSNVTGGAGHR